MWIQKGLAAHHGGGSRGGHVDPDPGAIHAEDGLRGVEGRAAEEGLEGGGATVSSRNPARSNAPPFQSTRLG